MKHTIFLICITLLLICSNESNIESNSQLVKEKRDLAFDQYKRSYNVLASIGLPKWAWNAQNKLIKSKGFIDSLYLVLEQPDHFSSVAEKLKSTIKFINIDERMEKLMVRGEILITRCLQH